MAYIVSDPVKYRERIYSGGAVNRATLTINDVNIPTERIKSIKVSDPIIDTTQDSFYVGTFLAKKVEIQFRNAEEIDLENGVVHLSIDTQIREETAEDDGYEEVPIGIFYIDTSPEDYYSSATITCYDGSILFKKNIDISQWFDKDESGNIVDISAEDLLKALCNHFLGGDMLGSYPSLHKTLRTGSYDSSQSGKYYISQIAEIMGCNAKIGRDGMLYLIPLNQEPVVEIDATKSKSWEVSSKYEITGVAYENIDGILPAGDEHKTVSGQGNEIVLNNTFEDTMKIDLYGNTSQSVAPTPSSSQPVNNVKLNNKLILNNKNLFIPEKHINKYHQTNCQLEYIDDGFKLNFNAESDAWVNEVFTTNGTNLDTRYRPQCIRVLPNTTYTLSSSSFPKCYVTYISKDFKSINFARIPNTFEASTFTFTTPSNCYYINFRFGIDTRNNEYSELTSWEFTGVQLELGGTSTDYEKGINKIQNIDLFNNYWNNVNNMENTFLGVTTKVENDIVTINGLAQAQGGETMGWLLPKTSIGKTLPAGTYTFKIEQTDGWFIRNNGTALTLWKYPGTSQADNLRELSYGFIFENGSTRGQFTIEEDTELFFSIYTNGVGQNYQDITLKISIYRDNENIELNKIGEYQDYIFKQENKWYVHKEIEKIIFDGDLNKISYTKAEQYSNENYTQINATINKTLNKGERGTNIICDTFSYYADATNSSKSRDGIQVATPNIITFSVTTNIATTRAEFTDWLVDNNVIAYCVLSEPTNIEITSANLIAQLNELEVAKSYNGTTNVFQINNDLPFELDATAFSQETGNILYLRNNNIFISGTTEHRQQIVNDLYNELNGFTIYALKNENYGDPSLDAYDIIEFDLDGEKFRTFNDNNLTYEMNIATIIETQIPSKQKQMITNNVKGESTKINMLEQEIDRVNNRITTTQTRVENVENDLAENTYSKTEINQLITEVGVGLTNVFSLSGGNNLLTNTVPYRIKNDTQLENWDGNINAIIETDSINRNALLLLQGVASQTVEVNTNNTYAVGFKFKQLITGATLTIKFNGREIYFDNQGHITYNDDTNLKINGNEITTFGVITNDTFTISFDCSTNGGYEIYELRLVHGDIALPWSQNQNELKTKSVNIGDGITIDSEQARTINNLDTDGMRVYSKTLEDYSLQTTDKGIETNDLTATGNSNVSGMLVQRVGDDHIFIVGSFL